MNDETANEPQRAQGGQTSAVSVFGQTGNMADFPVLKAFQEYVDAEQAKSRKRMLGLSVFFVILLIVVVVTFTLVLTTVINRNQSLSDRLLDVALRERAAAVPPPVAAVQQQPAPAPVADDSLVKPLLRKLESLAEAISESARQKLQPPALAVPQAAPVQAVPQTAPAPAVAPPAVSQPAETLEMLRLREELRRRHDALDAERRKIKEAREKLKEDRRRAEVEQHRRRLYPEHYARKDAEKAKGGPAAKASPAARPAAASAGQKPAPAASPAAPNQPAAARQPRGAGKAIDYFKQNEGDDEELAELVRKTNEVRRRAEKRKGEDGKANAAAAPAKAEKPAARPAPAVDGKKPERKTETVVVGENGGDSIPWLLNSPEGSK